MAVVEFPAASFTVEGSPEAIRESGRSYARFAGVVGEAAAGLRSLDSGSWVGSEGEEYRAQVAAIPPPLDVAHGAFGEVALALDVFAEAVEAAQHRMAGIRSDAESVHARLRSATADRDGMRPPTDDELTANPAAQHSYDTAHAAATGRVNGLQADFDAGLSAAGRVLSQVRQAADRAAARVRAAGRRSPTAGQNWFSDHWEKAGHWIDEHGGDIRDWLAHNAGWLRVVAGVLKGVGIALMAVAAVVAVASFIVGCFTGVGFLGEIPAGGIFEVGSLLYGAGDTLDTAVDWGEGKIDGTGLMWRAGLSMGLAVIGASVVKIGGKAALRLAERTGLDKKVERLAERLAERFGHSGGKVPERVPITRDNAPGLRPRGGGEENPLANPPPTYTYRNPALERTGHAKPTGFDLSRIGPSSEYRPGSEEHMLARWKEYRPKGKRWTWERWRDTYIRNLGNEPKGDAFEKAFREGNGFSETDGWRFDSPNEQANRHWDVWNPEAKVAYELKSGRNVDWKQVAKDADAVAQNEWDVVYVFGRGDVSPRTVARLEARGITVRIWESVGVPTG